MIDVTSKGVIKVQIEVIFHFVNKSRNPGTLPDIKRFYFGNDSISKQYTVSQFLRDLARQALQESQYYRKMMEHQQQATGGDGKE